MHIPSLLLLTYIRRIESTSTNANPNQILLVFGVEVVGVEKAGVMYFTIMAQDLQRSIHGWQVIVYEHLQARDVIRKARWTTPVPTND